MGFVGAVGVRHGTAFIFGFLFLKWNRKLESFSADVDLTSAYKKEITDILYILHTHCYWPYGRHLCRVIFAGICVSFSRRNKERLWGRLTSFINRAMTIMTDLTEDPIQKASETWRGEQSLSDTDPILLNIICELGTHLSVISIVLYALKVTHHWIEYCIRIIP